jgi:exodeoxyribonuclease-3
VIVATYNINGVNGRLSSLLAWLAKISPDVVCLQEIKTTSASFPHAALRKAGYHAVVKGQRATHGVAVLAKDVPPILVRDALPGDAGDQEARYLEVAVQGVLVACLYAPNGNPQPGPRFDYKLAWLERLNVHARGLWATRQPIALIGDYNVVPTDFDIYSAQSSWKSDALLQPAARLAYQRLLQQGWVDALRTLHPQERNYTFWDYKRNAWMRGAGLRIDHFLLSEPLQKALRAGVVDTEARGLLGASDHAPAWVEFDPAEGPTRRASETGSRVGKDREPKRPR